MLTAAAATARQVQACVAIATERGDKHNEAFVNSSEHPFLNRSATIKLFNISFTDPIFNVDFDDDGVFEHCNAPTFCNFVSYTTPNYVFNVSHFTTYSVTENNIAPNISNLTIFEFGAALINPFLLYFDFLV